MSEEAETAVRAGEWDYVVIGVVTPARKIESVEELRR